MNIQAVRLKRLYPPKDDLLEKMRTSALHVQNGDIIAIASKVVSIDEGRCIPIGTIAKDVLVKREAELYLDRRYTRKWHAFHTINKGIFIRNAGIDESNANGHYVLWPTRPHVSAKRLHTALCRLYNVKKLGVIITDSISSPLRRGATGFALSWYGFEPVYDYRGTKDIFGRKLEVSMANLADALAASTVLVMGEGNEQTPIAVIRDAPKTIWQGRRTNREWSSFIVPMKEDLFAPFLMKVPWKKGKKL